MCKRHLLLFCFVLRSNGCYEHLDRISQNHATAFFALSTQKKINTEISQKVQRNTHDCDTSTQLYKVNRLLRRKTLNIKTQNVKQKKSCSRTNLWRSELKLSHLILSFPNPSLSFYFYLPVSLVSLLREISQQQRRTSHSYLSRYFSEKSTIVCNMSVCVCEGSGQKHVPLTAGRTLCCFI